MLHRSIEVPLDELRERLAPLGAEGLRRLAGGASSLTYAATAAGGRPVVVKVAPAGVPPLLHRDVLRQARLLRALAGTAVPVPDVGWFTALACFKSVATWSLIVKHNRRRPEPDPEIEAMAATLPHLLRRAEGSL